MIEKEFAELELRMQVVPQQARWPKPEFVHWQQLHGVAEEARSRLRKSYAEMDDIDRNVDFSREGKSRQRNRIAAQAIADFESSKTLARTSRRGTTSG
jgi:hypothetical protein